MYFFLLPGELNLPMCTVMGKIGTAQVRGGSRVTCYHCSPFLTATEAPDIFPPTPGSSKSDLEIAELDILAFLSHYAVKLYVKFLPKHRIFKKLINYQEPHHL